MEARSELLCQLTAQAILAGENIQLVSSTQGSATRFAQRILQILDSMNYYTDFKKLASERYPHCTLTEQLVAYVQHKPGAIVPFLEQLIREKEKQHEQDR
jgi:hypothetical protein